MNQNVIITGANRGIGKAMVAGFAQNGDNVWACCREEREEFNKWISICAQKYSVWIHPVYFDLTLPQEIVKGFKSIYHEKRNIDVLVNCAGVGHLDLFQMTSMEKAREVYEVNLFALMQLCQLAIHVMRRQKKGKIINIVSTAAKEIYTGNCIYGASKSAVVAFSQSLAAEVAECGIQVNALAPGLTDTDMSFVFEGKNPELPLARSAIGRKLKPSEIADVAVALTSEAMKMVNGQMICVNGGAK